MRIVKNTKPDVAANITKRGGGTLTIASSVFEVFDTAGASVQAEGSSTITNNSTAEVTISGIVDSSVAGFVIDSKYELRFSYTIGSQAPLYHRVAIDIGEETGEAVSGNYISEDDIDNWPQGITDEGRLEVIERVEAEIERLTRDVFYEAPFDIFRDGPGSDVFQLSLRARIQSVSAVYYLGVAMETSSYSFTANALTRDSSGIATDSYLRFIENRNARLGKRGIFVEGLRSHEIVGTAGWPEKLAVDTVVGTFRAGETITGTTNSYTAIIKRVTDTALWIAGKSGQFVNDEVITGGTSAATAAVNSVNGAVNDVPNGIKQAAKMLVMWDNDSTLYTRYEEGSESFSGESYSNTRKPLTGIREIDRILSRYVRKIPRLAVV